MTNGNINGIKIVSLNKQSAKLVEKLEDMKVLIQEEKPHILALQEAEVPHDQPLHQLQIDGFNLFLDGLYHNGLQARTVVFVSKQLKTTQRFDLQNNEISLVSLTIGKPKQKKFNLLAFYRQWRTQNDDLDQRTASFAIPAQAARFEIITNLWEQSILEGKETITVSDTDLTNNAILDQNSLTQNEIKHKPISKHFSEKILPHGVIIVNNDPTHYSSNPNTPPSCIDHITTTKPAVISNVNTKTYGGSDHKMLIFIRNTQGTN